jgi:hypothetical protein
VTQGACTPLLLLIGIVQESNSLVARAWERLDEGSHHTVMICQWCWNGEWDHAGSRIVLRLCLRRDIRSDDKPYTNGGKGISRKDDVEDSLELATI